MTAYVIAYGTGGPSDDPKVYAFRTKESALLAATHGPIVPPHGGGRTHVVETSGDVALRFGEKQMAALCSALENTPIDRFESRSAGAVTIMNLLPHVAQLGESKMEEEVNMEEVKKPKRERKAPSLGEFKQLRHGTNLAKVAASIHAGHATVHGIASKAEIAVEKVIPTLNRARVTHGVDHAIDPDTGNISLIVPEGRELFTEPKTESDAPRGTRAGDRPAKSLAEFRSVKPGTIREAIVRRMDGTRTNADIADELGLTRANCHSHIICLHRDCGMGFSFDGEGRVSLVLPDGAGDPVKNPAAVPAEAA